MSHLSALQAHHFQYLSTCHQGFSESVTQIKLILSEVENHSVLHRFVVEEKEKRERPLFRGKNVYQFARSL